MALDLPGKLSVKYKQIHSVGPNSTKTTSSYHITNELKPFDIAISINSKTYLLTCEIQHTKFNDGGIGMMYDIKVGSHILSSDRIEGRVTKEELVIVFKKSVAANKYTQQYIVNNASQTSKKSKKDKSKHSSD